MYTARLLSGAGSLFAAPRQFVTDLTMAQFIEFIGNHLLLTGMWLATVAAIIFYNQRTASKSVGPAAAVMLINRRDAVVVDIREKKEFETGHIVDSINIPMPKLTQRITELQKYKDKPIVVVCKLGQQSAEAVKLLQEAGHAEVVKMTGGLTEWKAQSLPLVQK